jgi:hypothetical protein
MLYMSGYSIVEGLWSEGETGRGDALLELQVCLLLRHHTPHSHNVSIHLCVLTYIYGPQFRTWCLSIYTFFHTFMSTKN